jgi:hypothetical protein
MIKKRMLLCIAGAALNMKGKKTQNLNPLRGWWRAARGARHRA